MKSDMEYFILLPGDSKDDLIDDVNRLGERSFGVFWASQGLNILMKISQKHPEKLSEISIIDSKSRSYTVEEFVNLIEVLEVRVQN